MRSIELTRSAKEVFCVMASAIKRAGGGFLPPTRHRVTCRVRVSAGVPGGSALADLAGEALPCLCRPLPSPPFQLQYLENSILQSSSGGL